MTAEAQQLPPDSQATPQVYFRLTYITGNFIFGNAEIKVSDPGKGITISYTKRPKDAQQPPYEKNDGLIVAQCQRSLSERLYGEAVSTGILSQNKAAVKQVFDDMNDLIQRTLRLAR
jgi:hypothetical protein